MNNFSCTIWQFLMYGFGCLCGGISLGIVIGKDSRQEEINELNDRLISKESDEE